MKPRLADILATLGVLLIGGAFWMFHPAASVGFAGVVLTGLGVYRARLDRVKVLKQDKEAKS